MKILVLEGPVGAGKTRLMSLLKQILPERKEILFLEEPLFLKHRANGNFYNPLDILYKGDDYVSVQSVIHQKLYDYYKRMPVRGVKVVIMDRWIPSCQIFLQVGLLNGHLSKFAYDVHVDLLAKMQKKFIFKMAHDGNLNSMKDIKVFYLDTPKEDCVRNITLRKRMEEDVVDQDFWEDFTEKFGRVAKAENNKYSKIGDWQEIIKEMTSEAQKELGENFPGSIEFEKMQPEAILPQCQTKGSVGYDLSTPFDVEIPPKSIQKIKTGLRIKSLEGNFYPQIMGRSNLACKKCLLLCGTIDQDYSNEISVVLQNLNEKDSVYIKRGERIAQIVFLTFVKPLSFTTRELRKERVGGFGSTGSYELIDEKITRTWEFEAIGEEELEEEEKME
jgi:dUTP pyrophosphatase